MSEQRLLVFAGSYAEAEESGVYVYAFDENIGELRLLDECAGLKNPTFLNVNPDTCKLYAIGEIVSASGAKAGEAVAFDIDPVEGTIKLLNRIETVAAPTCHIQRNASGDRLTVPSYHGGMVGLLSIMRDGRVGHLLDIVQHEGTSVHLERQDRPHPHSTFYSPDGKLLFVQDLGLDRIRAYALDGDKFKLHSEAATHPGAGPRHLAFHPSGKFAFVINEVNSTITSFAYDAEAGTLTVIHTVSTLPERYEGENICAEIAVSADGAYVYGSNRGDDSIVVYAVDVNTGKLSLVQHISAQGQHPRHFALTPGGNYLIAANRDTNNIVTFQVDKTSGRLDYTGVSVSVPKPVCVQPFYFKL